MISLHVYSFPLSTILADGDTASVGRGVQLGEVVVVVEAVGDNDSAVELSVEDDNTDAASTASTLTLPIRPLSAASTPVAIAIAVAPS
jgi:hypothetical protein